MLYRVTKLSQEHAAIFCFSLCIYFFFYYDVMNSGNLQ